MIERISILFVVNQRTYDFQRVLQELISLMTWTSSICKRLMSSKICFFSDPRIPKSKVFTKEGLMRENVAISS